MANHAAEGAEDGVVDAVVNHVMAKTFGTVEILPNAQKCPAEMTKRVIHLREETMNETPQEFRVTMSYPPAVIFQKPADPLQCLEKTAQNGCPHEVVAEAVQPRRERVEILRIPMRIAGFGAVSTMTKGDRAARVLPAVVAMSFLPWADTTRMMKALNFWVLKRMWPNEIGRQMLGDRIPKWMTFSMKQA
jgi:hypothetical protein